MLAHDAQMRESFRIIDRNHDGEISFDELATTLRQVSPTASKLTDDELRAVFTRIDTRHDGVISYAEWVSAVYLLPTASVEAGSKRWFVFVPLFTPRRSAAERFQQSQFFQNVNDHASIGPIHNSQ